MYYITLWYNTHIRYIYIYIQLPLGSCCNPGVYTSSQSFCLWWKLAQQAAETVLRQLQAKKPASWPYPYSHPECNGSENLSSRILFVVVIPCCPFLCTFHDMFYHICAVSHPITSTKDPIQTLITLPCASGFYACQDWSAFAWSATPLSLLPCTHQIWIQW